MSKPTITFKTFNITTIETENENWVPVADLDPATDTHRLVGMLYFKKERPEMYSRARNMQLNAKFGRKFEDVFVLPYNASYVCFAEETIVYLLPGFDEDDDLGLKELTIPVYAKFYEMSEIQINESREVRSCSLRP